MWHGQSVVGGCRCGGQGAGSLGCALRGGPFLQPDGKSSRRPGVVSALDRAKVVGSFPGKNRPPGSPKLRNKRNCKCVGGNTQASSSPPHPAPRADCVGACVWKVNEAEEAHTASCFCHELPRQGVRCCHSSTVPRMLGRASPPREVWEGRRHWMRTCCSTGPAISVLNGEAGRVFKGSGGEGLSRRR